MITQGFWIGDRDWWVMVTYDIRTEAELNEAYQALLAAGCADDEAQRACMVLSGWNGGYTFTSFGDRATYMFIGKATSAEEMYDTCQHEMKHAVEHIGEFYGVDPRGEESAHLQGEMSRKMFPAVAMAVCPVCHRANGE